MAIVRAPSCSISPLISASERRSSLQYGHQCPRSDADHHRSGPEKGRERDKPPVLVRKIELRHRFAELGTDLTAIDHVKSLNKFIVGLGEIRPP